MSGVQPSCIHFLTIFASDGDIIVVPRSCRICLLVRLIMPWRFFAWVEITLPVPVKRKRFLTPDLVFSLGIWLSRGRGERERDPPTHPEMRAGMEHNTAATAALGRAAEGRRYGRWALCWQPPGYASRQPLARGEHHDHLAAFEFRLLLDLGHRREVAADALEQFGAELLVGELSAAEAQGDLGLVAFLAEPPDRAHLHVVIVIVDHGPELDFLDLDDLLLLARLGGLLLLLVFEYAVVEDLADRGGLVGDDLDEVQPRFGGDGERVADLNGAVVLSLLIDQLHLANANLIVDARAVLLNGQRGFHRATNGEDLLCLLRRAVSRVPTRIRAPAAPRCCGPKKIGRNDAEVNVVPEAAPHPAGRPAAAAGRLHWARACGE